MWWGIKSKIRLQNYSGFCPGSLFLPTSLFLSLSLSLLFYHLFSCSLSLSSLFLGETRCSIWIVLWWEVIMARDWCLWPTASEDVRLVNSNMRNLKAHFCTQVKPLEDCSVSRYLDCSFVRNLWSAFQMAAPFCIFTDNEFKFLLLCILISIWGC